MRARKRPRYSLHKPSGQARVIIKGKHHYLGAFDSRESHELYEKLISDWVLADGDQILFDLTVNELCVLFIAHAVDHYCRKDGTPTGTTKNVKEALRYVVKLFGRTQIKDFGPRKLKVVRDAMIDDGRVRSNINRLIHWIRRTFRWGVENEYVSVGVYTALQAVAALQPGRSKVKESEPVAAVAMDVVTQTVPHLTSVVAAMVRLQLLTGARPGEITKMRPCDVENLNKDVWVYRPSSHKTEHRGKRRVIHLGPEAQKILKPFLGRNTEAYCFTPAEALQESFDRRSSACPRTKKKQSALKHIGQTYNKDTFNRAICRACEVAFEMPNELRRISASLPMEEKTRRQDLAKAWRAENCWSAGQLRHTRATDIREKYGIEAAQLVLGHSDLKITEIYAERNDERVADIMREVG